MIGVVRSRWSEETNSIEEYDWRCAHCIDFTPAWHDGTLEGDRTADAEDTLKECTYCDRRIFTEYVEDEPEQDESKVKYAEGFVFVNVYELDRVFGGPEEGGGYFTTGTLIASRQVPEAQAEAAKLALEDEYPGAAEATRRSIAEWEANGSEGRPYRTYPYDSVCYSGGDYHVWIENLPGADFPEEYPHYE